MTETNEMCNNYAAYVRMDMKKEIPAVENTIEELLTRLDEFENLVTMVRAEGALCVDDIMPKVLSSRPRLDELCDRIDRLDQLILRVEADLTHVEATVDQAEQDLSTSSTSRLKTLLKPLFFKSSSESSEKKLSRQTPTQTLGELYRTETYFPPE